MNVRLNRKGKSLKITGTGLSALLLLAVILATPYYLALPDEPTPAQAERLVRLHLKKLASQRYADVYENSRMTPEAGSLYQDQIDQIDELAFETAEVGRLLPDYYLSRDVPSYFTKVVYVDSDGVQQTRYFSLGSGRHVIAERSGLVWFFVL